MRLLRTSPKPRSQGKDLRFAESSSWQVFLYLGRLPNVLHLPQRARAERLRSLVLSLDFRQGNASLGNSSGQFHLRGMHLTCRVCGDFSVALGLQGHISPQVGFDDSPNTHWLLIEHSYWTTSAC